MALPLHRPCCTWPRLTKSCAARSTARLESHPPPIALHDRDSLLRQGQPPNNKPALLHLHVAQAHEELRCPFHCALGVAPATDGPTWQSQLDMQGQPGSKLVSMCAVSRRAALPTHCAPGVAPAPHGKPCSHNTPAGRRNVHFWPNEHGSALCLLLSRQLLLVASWTALGGRAASKRHLRAG